MVTEDVQGPFKGRINVEAVARILGLIASVPNKRGTPLAGDIDGRFDFWFDGGACQQITGWNEYVFQDGTVAEDWVVPRLTVMIRFPDGRRVRVQQESGGKREAA